MCGGRRSTCLHKDMQTARLAGGIMRHRRNLGARLRNKVVGDGRQREAWASYNGTLDKQKFGESSQCNYR